jgi:hypothetical protein
MRLLLDENLPISLGPLLNGRGPGRPGGSWLVHVLVYRLVYGASSDGVVGERVYGVG